MEGRDTHFECSIKSDLFKVCAEHVAFGEIVVPGALTSILRMTLMSF